MIKELLTFSRMIQGVETTLRAYAFEWKKKKVRLIPGKVHTLSKDRSLRKYIYNSCVALVADTSLLRTASFETEDKVEALLVLAQSTFRKRVKAQKKQHLRLSVSYVASPEREWDLIETQNRRLIVVGQQLPEGDQVVQISLGTGSLFSSRPPMSRVKSDQEALDKIPRFMNMEGWASYCAWYNELLEDFIAHVLYAATEAYTLEGSLKDFKHEVFSPYLRWTRQRLAELEQAELKKNEEHVTQRERVEMTRRRISHQRDLGRMVEAHYAHLADIVKLVAPIEAVHPDLHTVREIGQVLEKLLADQLGLRVISWGESHMLLQLLNDQFGVLSAISGSQGLGRTHFAFAIRLAVLQMKQLVPREDLFRLVLDWEDASKTTNKLVALKGAGDSNYAQVSQFRECILGNLLEFCQPIASLNAEEPQRRWREGLRENPEVMNFLPPYDFKGVPLVHYDAETGAPQELTLAGRHLLFNLSR